MTPAQAEVKLGSRGPRLPNVVLILHTMVAFRQLSSDNRGRYQSKTLPHPTNLDDSSNAFFRGANAALLMFDINKVISNFLQSAASLFLAPSQYLSPLGDVCDA
ncbi:hypothetical protein AX14_010349 [Amanita brunnescens Koide BX004]|nr:hypothetical protein AX14_010349 [Amanita brunnescens Koide BX004]